MDVDRIVHHAFIEAVFRQNQAFAVGIMGCVRTGGGDIVGSLADEDATSVEVDVFRTLGQQSHTETVMDGDVIESRVFSAVDDTGRMGTSPGTECQSISGKEAFAFQIPALEEDIAFSKIFHRT